MLNVHTIHGAKLGDYFSAGIGVGADLYHEVEMEVMVPVFLNVKGYLPTNTKVTPFASFDIGAGIGASANIKGISGMLITPAIGVKVGMFKAQLGYNVQKISESGVSVNMNALQLKVGVVF